MNKLSTMNLKNLQNGNFNVCSASVGLYKKYAPPNFNTQISILTLDFNIFNPKLLKTLLKIAVLMQLNNLTVDKFLKCS